ncbi:MBL fold metallo-hydrolase [Clavibacter tessellarius]|uniref:Zn-dependent hydrolase n=1 Tax=Clavibacter tessellarius TaxID=31965 RepID=A0A154V3E5_9MICO|nr:MBL fold metallo-hydrolase [Clavibacter michiganensis]KZC95881.1 Zn-dependent hydrolase [Clavibacter michiganensis subsp. tessellarius]
MSAPWHVTSGGPSHVHRAGDVEIRKASVGPMDNDAYLLTDLDSGERLLVDAAADVDRLLALVAEPDPVGRLAVVVTTHGHADHHGALAALLDATGATSAVGAADAGDLPVDADRRLAHGDEVAFGGVTVGVVALRGHTPGSVALVLEPGDGSVHLFTGDSLFPGGVGNTGGDADRFRQLVDDVGERLFARFPDDAIVHPGHGDATTLGAERGSLAGWRARGW